jgi:hypothetical protein
MLGLRSAITADNTNNLHSKEGSLIYEFRRSDSIIIFFADDMGSIG